ncbi:activating transcription factor 3 isoform X2 [Ischnura elegans]|uniref:activating transcription factor 3 isoform X2 n=1 Tax=Ischnura elegans TaxID=197161 RepID=UPI001ED86E25|nr:activating transcription factor 3 isoform X2 [Ischnura elegans]
MYNLNVNLATSATSLAVEGVCTTPKTPEILNSLIAMTNPFDNCYPNSAVGGNINHQVNMVGQTPRTASSPPEHSSGGMLGSPGYAAAPSPGRACSSPRNHMMVHSPPSVQSTCSQLIKEGLKLQIQTKRRQSKREPVNLPSTASVDTDGDDIYGDSSPSSVDSKAPRKEELTAEDEERRRRRRERNKIAATKCRLKKRERTVNLVQESEILESQNHEMKSQIQELENQRRRLLDMLSIHSPTCVKNCGDVRNSRVMNEGLYPSSSSAASSSSSISSVSSSSIPTSSPNSSTSSLSAASIPASSPSLMVDPNHGGLPPTPPGPPVSSATPAPYEYEGIPGGDYHLLHRQINHDTHHNPHTQHSQQLAGHHINNQSQLQHQQHLVEGW